MKILIAAEIFPPDIGGPATYTVKLANALIDRDHQVEVVCYSDEKQEDDFKFKVHRIIRSKFKFPHYRRYEKTLEGLVADFDIIYAMGPVGSGKPALKVAQKLNKKLIVKVVGDYAWEQAQGSGKTKLLLDEFQAQAFSGKIGMLQKIERSVCQSAHKVVVPSQYLKKIVSGWGVNEENIEVVYNAVSLPSIARQDNKEEDLIVSIGRLVSWKGFAMLLDVFQELVKENSKLKLLILGSGPEDDNLDLKITKLNLGDKVTVEEVDAVKRDKYLARAKMFVLNTGYEGLSHTVLEAFAAGVPVITTNVGGNPELVEDEVSGLLIDYNNHKQLKEAISILNHDNDLQHNLTEGAKEKLKDFTFEKMINNTIKVLQS